MLITAVFWDTLYINNIPTYRLSKKREMTFFKQVDNEKVEFMILHNR